MATGIVPGALIGGVADPHRINETTAIGNGLRGSIDITHTAARHENIMYNDSSILFEAYHYWAHRSRAVEKSIEVKSMGFTNIFQRIVDRGKGSREPTEDIPDVHDGEKKISNEQQSDVVTSEDGYGIIESELDNAQRAVRTATWGTHA
jgi:hypothetical protein